MKEKSNKADLALLRQFFFEHGHVHIPDFPEYESLFQFSNKLRTSRSLLSSGLKAQLDSMGFRWDLNLSNELRWHFHYSELERFYHHFKHTRVPAKNGDYKSLGAWVQRQRRDELILSTDKKRLLNRLGFQWANDIKKKKEDYWKSMFRQLQAFRKKHGHVNIPDRSKENEKLGRWVSTVRYSEARLEDWKKKLLNSVRFKFRDDIKSDKQKHRKQLFDNLNRFYKKHGHSNVPEGHSDHKLSIFVSYLRQHPERINMDEKRKLREWKFLFSEDIKRQWEKLWLKSFEKLKKFKTIYGHCRVSSTFKDQPLARWVSNQRKDKKDGKLPFHREKMLRALDFSFYEDVAQLLEQKWFRMYLELIRFKKTYGTTVVQESYKNKKLVNWVLHQRQAKNSMPKKRKKLLDKVGFVWRAR